MASIDATLCDLCVTVKVYTYISKVRRCTREHIGEDERTIGKYLQKMMEYGYMK